MMYQVYEGTVAMHAGCISSGKKSELCRIIVHVKYLRLYISILSQCCRPSSGTTKPELVPTTLPETSALEFTIQCVPGVAITAMSTLSASSCPPSLQAIE